MKFIKNIISKIVGFFKKVLKPSFKRLDLGNHMSIIKDHLQYDFNDLWGNIKIYERKI